MKMYQDIFQIHAYWAKDGVGDLGVCAVKRFTIHFLSAFKEVFLHYLGD